MNKQPRSRSNSSWTDGDLKAGSNSLCTDTVYTAALDYFNSLEAPAMFTPGDNEWTDCDRSTNGAHTNNLWATCSLPVQW